MTLIDGLSWKKKLAELTILIAEGLSDGDPSLPDSGRRAQDPGQDTSTKPIREPKPKSSSDLNKVGSGKGKGVPFLLLDG